MKIEGLPEGVDCVRIGMAGPDEYELVKHDGRVDLIRGGRKDSMSQIVVAPAPGYRFAEVNGFDIRNYEMGKVIGVVKILEQPREISATIKYRVDTQEDSSLVEQELARMRKLPGYLEG